MTPAWSGSKYLFADYYEGHFLGLFALQRLPGGGARTVRIAAAEEDGGEAELRAIGFANADRDKAEELIVLLEWPQVHRDFYGSFYEVRIFDDLKPGTAKAVYFKALSNRFDPGGCDCYPGESNKWSPFRYKTVGKVKAKLRKMGF